MFCSCAASPLQHRLHVAEGSRENEVVPLARQLVDDPLRVGAFRHILDEGNFDFPAEGLFNRLPPQVVLVSPSRLANRADIDKADL